VPPRNPRFATKGARPWSPTNSTPNREASPSQRAGP
jgi:hypothetical protein